LQFQFDGGTKGMRSLGTFILLLFFASTPLLAEDTPVPAAGEHGPETTEEKDSTEKKEEKPGDTASAETPDGLAAKIDELLANVAATSTDLRNALTDIEKAISDLEKALEGETNPEAKAKLAATLDKLTKQKETVANKQAAITAKSLETLTAQKEAEAKAKAETEVAAKAAEEKKPTETAAAAPASTHYSEPLTTFQNIVGTASSSASSSSPAPRSQNSQSRAPSQSSFPRTSAPAGTSNVPTRIAAPSVSAPPAQSTTPAVSSPTAPTAPSFVNTPITASAGSFGIGATAPVTAAPIAIRSPASLPMPALTLDATDGKLANKVSPSQPDPIAKSPTTDRPEAEPTTIRPATIALANNTELPKSIDESRGVRQSNFGVSRGIYASAPTTNAETAKGSANSPAIEQAVERLSNYAPEPKERVWTTTAQVMAQGKYMEYVSLDYKTSAPTDTVTVAPIKVTKALPAPQIAKVDFKAVPTYNSPTGVKDPLLHRGLVASDPAKAAKKKDFQSFRENPFL